MQLVSHDDMSFVTQRESLCDDLTCHKLVFVTKKEQAHDEVACVRYDETR